MPKPEGDKAVYDMTRLAGGDVAIVALKGVEEGNQEQAKELGGEKMLNAALQRSRGETYYQDMLKNLHAEGDIAITQQQ